MGLVRSAGRGCMCLYGRVLLISIASTSKSAHIRLRLGRGGCMLEMQRMNILRFTGNSWREV